MAGELTLYFELALTTALGPGRRYAVWVKGCPMDCPGCMTQEARAFDGGYKSTPEALADRILAAEGIEGVTFSGGEPFAHASGLARVARILKAERDIGIMAYSGYALDELRTMALRRPEVADLLSGLDVLIDGRYQAGQDDGGRWRGSKNQQAHLLTDRYREAMAGEFGQAGRRVELHLGKRELFLAGVPDKKTLDYWRQLTGSGEHP